MKFVVKKCWRSYKAWIWTKELQSLKVLEGATKSETLEAKKSLERAINFENIGFLRRATNFIVLKITKRLNGATILKI